MIPIILYSISIFLILIFHYFNKSQNDQHENNLNHTQNDNNILDQNQCDLTSLSSNVSLTTKTFVDLQNDRDSNINNNNSNSTTTTDLNDNSYLKKKLFNCYTYTYYKELSLKNSKKKQDNDALIVEFFKKYFNKNLLFKHLGIGGGCIKNEGFKINDSFK
jgi:hypothetical protein